MGKIIRDTDVVDKSLSDALKKLEKSLQNIVNSLNAVADSSKKVNIQTKQSQQTFSKTSDNINKASQNSQQLTALEKERIRVQKQLQATLAKSLSIRENNAKTLAKGKALLQARNKALKQAAELQFLNSKEGKKLNEQIKKQNQELRKSKGASGGLAKSMGGVLARFTALGAIIGTFGKILKDAFNKVKAFDKAMDDTRAVLGATDEEIKKLQEDALRLGATTQKTATEVAGLQKEYAKLGFSVKEILNATEATIQLSVATGSDLAEAASVAGATVRGFGLDASETQRVVDVMALSFSSSALDLDKFKTAMGVVAPVAKSAGVSIEEATGYLAQFVDAGVDASTAGTSLRNIFLELSRQGITLDEALDKIRNSSDKNKTAFELFGKRGATVATIMADTSIKAEELTEKLQNSQGAAGEMARVMSDNLAGDIELAKSAWEGFVLSLEDGNGIISESLRATTTSWTQFLTFLTRINEGDSARLANLKRAINLNEARNNLIDVTTKKVEKLAETENKTQKEAIQQIREETEARIESSEKELETAKRAEKAKIELKLDFEKIVLQSLDDLEKAEEVQQENSIKLQFEKLAEEDKIREENIKKQQERNKERLKEIEQQFEIELNKQKELLLNEQITRERFANWLINREIQTQEELLEISTLSAKERLKIESELLDKKLELKNQEQEFNANLIISEQEIDALLAEDEKEQAEETIRLNDQVTESRIENIEKEKEAREAAIIEGINLASSLFEFSAALRERELSDLEIQKENELALAGDNTKEREKIEERFAKKEAEIKRKQLISDKAQAIFNAIVNTAVAVTKVFATLGPLAPLVAGLIAAQGAAQVATIAARPLPKFAEGVQDFSGGLAMVGDEIGSKSGHSRELLNIPGKGLILSPDQPTIMNLPKGSDVIPNLESELILKGGIQSEKLDELIKSNNRVENAINNRPEHIFNATDKGFEKIVKTKNAYIKYKDTYLRK